MEETAWDHIVPAFSFHGSQIDHPQASLPRLMREEIEEIVPGFLDPWCEFSKDIAPCDARMGQCGVSPKEQGIAKNIHDRPFGDGIGFVP